MKFTFFAVALSVAMLMGCSHVQDSKRIPASIKDVGVIGPDGEVILFYRDGDHIAVRNCHRNTVLGSTPAQARANCKGRTNNVPVESFKQELRNFVSVNRLHILKPLTPEEIQEYTRYGRTNVRVENMLLELEKVNAFIATYGAEGAVLVRKEELVKALNSHEALVKVIKKIDAEVEKALNLITDQTKLALAKVNSDEEQFLYTVLQNFNPAAKFPCGLSGPVEDRIRDCSYQLSSERGEFVLVSRSKEFKEIYQETKTGLLWGDRLQARGMTHYAAEKACKNDLAEVVSEINLHWRLPTRQEFEEAERNGIVKMLPNMNTCYWTSGTRRGRPAFAYAFFSNMSTTEDLQRTVAACATRCVAR